MQVSMTIGPFCLRVAVHAKSFWLCIVNVVVFVAVYVFSFGSIFLDAVFWVYDASN